MSGDLCVTCGGDELARHLAFVKRALPPKRRDSQADWLRGVLLTAAGKELRVTATDMELALTAGLPAMVAREGSVLLPGRELASFAASLGAGDVAFEQRPGEDTVRVTSVGANLTLPAQPASDFPRLPEAPRTYPVERAAFIDTFAHVQRAVSGDESRPLLTGVFVRFEPDSLVMVATDSYRFAIKRTPQPHDTVTYDFVVTARALRELSSRALRAIGADSSVVGIAVKQSHVFIRAGGVMIIARRIDGQFPTPWRSCRVGSHTSCGCRAASSTP
jgi:DNA polymerase-3 subunit beta